MKILLYSLFILPLLIGCKNDPDIIFGDTYFHQNKIQKSSSNWLDGYSSQTALSIQGVYWQHFYAVHSYPAILTIHSDNHLTYTLLSAPLDIPHGDLIYIAGFVQDSLIKVGATAQKPIHMLEANKVQIIQPSHAFISAAQKDYSMLYTRLTQENRLAESKLNFPQFPNWQLLVDEQREKAVLYFSAADLMYALDVNFVYNQKNEELEQVFINEWFKGE